MHHLSPAGASKCRALAVLDKAKPVFSDLHWCKIFAVPLEIKLSLLLIYLNGTYNRERTETPNASMVRQPWSSHAVHMQKILFDRAGAVQYTYAPYQQHMHTHHQCSVYHRQSTSRSIQLEDVQIRVYGSVQSFFDDALILVSAPLRLPGTQLSLIR